MGRIFRFQRQDNSRYGEDQENQTMRIEGMPERFWIVTSPTPVSELGDCCFVCSFKQFALQIRGGLEVDSIIGIYADGETAKATATKLIEAMTAEPSDADKVIHPSPWLEWLGTQSDTHSVWICDKTSDERIKVEPPADWGNAWAWNVTEDGTGILMRRTT